MIRVLANDTIADSAIIELENSGFEVIHHHYENDELLNEIKNFDCIIVRSGTKVRNDVIDASKETGRLKLIVRGGVGVDNINVKYAEENAITVKNTPNASSNSVAELAIGHMFALLRYIHMSNVSMRKGEWNKKKYKGYELMGKTLGLYGFGRIGQSVAKKASALGMKVIYNTRSGEKPGFDDFKYVELDELYKSADIISLHVGASLDVFENEPKINSKLLNCDKISLTPHIGASTYEAQTRIGEEICSVIVEFFK